jgi:penicillin-binding protein 1A
MSGGGRDRSQGRREPSFGGDTPSSGGLRLTQDDRAVVSNRSSARSSPRQDEADASGGFFGKRDKTQAKKPQKDSKPPRRSSGGGSLIGRLFYWAVVMGLWGFIGVCCLFVYHASKLPPIDQLSVPKRPPNIAILAMDGSLLANRGETGGRTMALSELPDYLPKAFVAIEDHRFYDHFGIDPLGIARALIRNVLRSGGPMQGGSTLTQQLAKNLFLTQERTASRKIQEAILALWLERNYTKNQILELYLNRVYFGAGAYGVEAAAQRYFSKSARQVSLSEAAILGGLVQSPSRLAPNRNPAGAQARSELVLAAMQREGFVTDEMVRLALANPARAMRPSGAGSLNYAADYVMDVLDDFIGTIENDVMVTTTLDPFLQAQGEKALVEELQARGEKFGVSQGAFVAMRPDGAIKAMVGGRSYSESQYNRVVAAKRQPGSSFKAFVFLSAIERGLTPETVRDDAPISIKGWSPENYSRKYLGPVTLKNALAQSLNTVSVRLCLEVGPKTVASTAARLGIRSKLEANASIALGTSEVSPLEMVGAYATFANGGLGVLPYVITEVRTREGELVYSRSGGGLGQVVAPQAVGMMNVMLHETMLTGTARKGDIAGWELAGKTGTSQDFRDAWFVGYSSTLVAGVWLGNDDGSATKHLSGATMPVDIWHKFMLAALKSEKPQPLPGLNDTSGWSLDIPALLGFGSRQDNPRASNQSVMPQAGVSNTSPETTRTPALPPQPQSAPTGQVLLPPASIASSAPPVNRAGSGPLVITPEPVAARSQPDPSQNLLPPRQSIPQPQTPAAFNSQELRPPAAVGEGQPQPRTIRQEPSLLGRILGGG